MDPSPPLSLSPSAVRHLQHLKAENPAQNSYFRIRVISGGCSGLQYQFSFDKEPLEGDAQVTQGEATLLVDSASLDFIKGSKLDYVEELVGSYFTLRNPQAKSSCGCGTSFTPDLGS